MDIRVNDSQALTHGIECAESLEYAGQQSFVTETLPIVERNNGALLADRQRQSHKKIKAIVMQTEYNQRLLEALDRKSDNLQLCVETLLRGQATMQQQQTDMKHMLERHDQAADAQVRDDWQNTSEGCFCGPWRAVLHSIGQMRFGRAAHCSKKNDNDDVKDSLLATGTPIDQSFVHANRMEHGQAPVQRSNKRSIGHAKK